MYDIPDSDRQKIEAEVFGAPAQRIGSFYLHAQKDPEATIAQGHPVYRDVPYCTIRLKGERDYISSPANDALRAEFPQAWAQFERARSWDQHALTLLPQIPPSVVASLRDLNVHTIEQLAATGVPEAFAAWRAKAVHWQRFWSGEKPRIRLEVAA